MNGHTQNGHSENGHSDHAAATWIELIIPSDPGEACRVQDEIEKVLQKNHFGDRDVFCIKLALEEALVNAIKHGNQMDRTKRVFVSFLVQADRFECRVTDEGPGFDPADVPDPTDVENLERACGRGLMLMRHYMNEIVYSPRGNSVMMRKILRK